MTQAESLSKSLRRILNKVSVSNFCTTYEELRKLLSTSPEGNSVFVNCLGDFLHVEYKLVDVQMICFASLAVLYSREFDFDVLFKSLSVPLTTFNGTNLMRLLGFAYVLGSLQISETFKLVTEFLDSRDDICDPVINLLQCCGWKMRADDPVKTVEFIDHILGMDIVKHDQTSRGRFLREALEDLRNNGQRIIKRIHHADIDSALLSLTSKRSTASKVPSYTGQCTLSRKINTKSRKAILDAMNNCDSIHTCLFKLSPWMGFDSFDFDLVLVCAVCSGKEITYNPFYSMLLSELLAKRYKLRRAVRGYLSTYIKSISSASFREVIHVAYFFGDLIVRSSCLRIQNFSDLPECCSRIKAQIFFMSLLTRNKFSDDVLIEFASKKSSAEAKCDLGKFSCWILELQSEIAAGKYDTFQASDIISKIGKFI